MPDFENLRKVLLCQGEPDRVPSIEFHVDRSIKEQMLGRPVKIVEDDADFYMKAGYDFAPILFGMRLTLVERAAAASRAGRAAGHMKSAEAQYGVNLPGNSQRLWAEERSGLVPDMKALEAFDWPDPDAYNYDDVQRLGKALPDGAKVIPTIGYIFAAAWMLVGFERFCIDLAEGGRLASAVVDRIGRIHHRVIENLLDFDCVGAVCMPDDLAYTHSLMVRPAFLRDHVFPWHERIGRMVRGKNLPYLFHSDGNYSAVIDDLIQCGYHSLHPCEPASFDIASLKQEYRGRLCLCGNINLDSTLTLGSPDDVREEVKLRIRTVGPGGGYACGSSNSVTEYVPFENYLAMLEAVRRFGRYPIRI